MSQTLVPPSAPPNPSPPPAASTPPGPPPGGVVRERGRIEYKWLAAGVVIFGTVMAILDQTVVNVALPQLETDFNTSLTTIQWIITGYSLSLASVIPLSGMARRSARRQVGPHQSASSSSSAARPSAVWPSPTTR